MKVFKSMLRYLLYSMGAAFVIFSLTCCDSDDTCEYCTRCISYDEDLKIKNEVRQCYDDSVQIADFNQGFMDGAASVGRQSICFDEGLRCY